MNLCLLGGPCFVLTFRNGSKVCSTSTCISQFFSNLSDVLKTQCLIVRNAHLINRLNLVQIVLFTGVNIK